MNWLLSIIISAEQISAIPARLVLLKPPILSIYISYSIGTAFVKLSCTVGKISDLARAAIFKSIAPPTVILIRMKTQNLGCRGSRGWFSMERQSLP